MVGQLLIVRIGVEQDRTWLHLTEIVDHGLKTSNEYGLVSAGCQGIGKFEPKLPFRIDDHDSGSGRSMRTVHAPPPCMSSYVVLDQPRRSFVRRLAATKPLITRPPRRGYLYRDRIGRTITLCTICASPFCRADVSTFMLRTSRGCGEGKGCKKESGDEAVHETILDGVMRQFGVVLQLHFFENPCPIGIDGADAHAQIIRDIFQALSHRHQTHDLVDRKSTRLNSS